MSKYQKSFHFGLGYVPKDFQIRDEVYIDESGYTSQPKETQLVQEINIPTIHTTSNLVSIPDIVYLPKEEVTTTFIDTPRPIIADVKPLINSNLLFTNQQVTVTPTTTGVVTGTKPITPVTTTNYTGTVNTTTKAYQVK